MPAVMKHMCAPGQVVDDVLDRLLRRRRADRRPRPRTQTLGHLHAKLDLVRRVRLGKRLRVGVGDDELHPVELLLDHVVDRVAAGAPDAEHGDPGLQVRLLGHHQVQCHRSVRLSLCAPGRGAFWVPVRGVLCRLPRTLMKPCPEVTKKTYFSHKIWAFGGLHRQHLAAA
jgi:hypothetical protein